MPSEKSDFAKQFSDFTFGSEPGLGTWLSDLMHPVVYERLSRIGADPLTKVQLNQLLVISHAPSVSDGFFHYYWTSCPPHHPYEVGSITGFDPSFASGAHRIVSVRHLAWGLRRLYVDGLLFFGNVKAAFNTLRSRDLDSIALFFRQKAFDTEKICDRGPPLRLCEIPSDERHLISEMVCKTFNSLPTDDPAKIRELVKQAWTQHATTKGGRIGLRKFLREHLLGDGATSEDQLSLSFDEHDVTSEGEALDRMTDGVTRFVNARQKAIENTDLYLSMVNDLDVYVATSMRTRQHFRDMAAICEQIFTNPKLSDLHLRYFDPTVSAASGHEDKGLIECLMVKCAKVLIYYAGEKESYGKDAEAAMALSLGKPVIFLCDANTRAGFYRDVHPLARLIDFRSGVAVGAIVTDTVDDVAELLSRIFRNRMTYRLEHHKERKGFLRLVESLTDSVVRIQTNDELLKKTFWNNYHNRDQLPPRSLATGKEAERIRE